MAEKRIINLTEATELSGGDYLVVDSASSGTRKVSGSVINSAIGEVASDLDTLSARVDQIIAPSGEAPSAAEVSDARVGADGVTYTTLGGAIRTQVTDLKSDLDEVEDVVNLEFVSIPVAMETNGLDVNGWRTTNAARSRTAFSLPVDMACSKFVFPPNTKHRFFYYDGYYPDNDPLLLYLADWSTDTVDYISIPTLSDTSVPLKLKIMVGYTDDRTITSANLPTVKIEYFYNKNDGAPYVNGSYPQYGSPPSIRVDNNIYNLSAILPVKPNTAYRSNKFRVTFTFGEGLQVKRALAPADLSNNLLTTNADEYYVLYCWKTTDCDRVYFEEADDYIGGANIENLVPISLKGKYLSLLGDSISSYVGTVPAGNDVYYDGYNSGMDSPSQMWWSVLCDRLGMKPLIIDGYSGAGVTQLQDSAHVGKVPMSSDARCSALHSGTTNPDIIIIAGGVNDYTYALSAQSEPLEWDGLTAPVLGNSFTEAYACMIKKLQTNYPNAIVVCLSTWFTMRGDDNGYTLTHTVGNNKYTQADYNKAIEHVAKQMHVPFIDVSNIGFNRNNFYPTYAEDSSTIPTHPNKVGQGVMGRAIANKLPELVKAYLK